jgi:hypothetical protein
VLSGGVPRLHLPKTQKSPNFAIGDSIFIEGYMTLPLALLLMVFAFMWGCVVGWSMGAPWGNKKGRVCSCGVDRACPICKTTGYVV